MTVRLCEFCNTCQFQTSYRLLACPVYYTYIPAELLSSEAGDGARVCSSPSRGRLAGCSRALSKCCETSLSRSLYQVMIFFVISSLSLVVRARLSRYSCQIAFASCGGMACILYAAQSVAGSIAERDTRIKKKRRACIVVPTWDREVYHDCSSAINCTAYCSKFCYSAQAVPSARVVRRTISGKHIL